MYQSFSCRSGNCLRIIRSFTVGKKTIITVKIIWQCGLSSINCALINKKAMFGILEKLHKVLEAVLRTEQTQHLIFKKINKMENELQALEDILTNIKGSVATIATELQNKIGSLPDGAISAADVATFKSDLQGTADSLAALAAANAVPPVNS